MYSYPEKWIQMYNHYDSYGRYFRESRNLFRGIMTGGPNQGQVYISLYSPDLSYEDYCKIMLQTKYDGSCWITFECSSFKDYYYFWSGWLYLLFWSYCPRDAEFFRNTSKEAFKQWFIAEVQEAAHYEAWFVFNLSFRGSELHYEQLIHHNLLATKLQVIILENYVFLMMN
jgi:hypothetical protein